MKNYMFESLGLILFLGLGIASVSAATQITGLSFDPLGSQSTPYAIGGLTIGLSVIAGGVLIHRLRAQTVHEKNSTTKQHDRYGGMIEVLGLLLIALFYSLALFEFRLPFSLVTAVFLPVATCLLEPGRRPFIALILGVVIGFCGEIILTKAFFIDLPTLL